jgi:hypothetical protein
MGANYGWKCNLSGNGGTTGTPTWAEILIVADTKLAPSFSENVIPTREGKGLELSEPNLLKIEVTGKMRVEYADADYVKWDTAFATKGELDLLVLNGPPTVNGVTGYRLAFKLHKFEESQGNEEILMKDFVLKPCLSAVPRKRAKVVSGTIAYSDLITDPA